MPASAKRSMTYIGIDPGARGGLVAMWAGCMDVVPMPGTERDIWQWFAEYAPPMDTIAVIEKVGGYVDTGPGHGPPGPAMFNFGWGYGGLRMAMIATGIPFEEITPQRWQKALSIPPRKKGESKKDWKNRLKARAQQLFPQVAVTLATADALLIAEYCRRKHEGRL